MNIKNKENIWCGNSWWTQYHGFLSQKSDQGHCCKINPLWMTRKIIAPWICCHLLRSPASLLLAHQKNLHYTTPLSHTERSLQKFDQDRAKETGQRVKTFASKHNNLRLLPRTQMAEGENWPQKGFLCPLHMYHSTHEHTWEVNTYTN